MNTAIAIYVHLPWCVRKCPYCDFNSHAAPGRIPELTYVKALLADLDADLDLATDRTVTSVFLGGGTPSLFGTESIGTLLAGIASRLPLATDVEITMEANPGTIEHGRFEGYAAAGVNRVSLGAQSFDAARLKALGRIHGPEEISVAVSELRAASITNFNLDLMYALPEQTTAGALADLAAGMALGPAHLSHYQLTLEPGTAFYYRPPPLPDDDQAFEMQEACQQMLVEAGFAQYEVSAYARPGRQCRHNLNYWRFGDYLGIGAGAHGKLTVGDRIIRTEKTRMPREYLRRAAEGVGNGDTRRYVPVADLPFEFMLNALRLHEGFTLADFERTTALAAQTLASLLAELTGKALMAETGGRWRPTGLGFRFLNDLQAAFLPPGAGVAGGQELYTAASRLGPQRDFRHIVTDVP
jgi:oxygen-independent coproporphyrinogen-3 oxidase